MYCMLLCSVPFEFPRRVVFKANIPKWMSLFSIMSPLCLKYFFSFYNFKLQGYLSELYPPPPASLQEQWLCPLLRSSLFGFCSRSKPRESALVLNRNVIALSAVLTARFGHLKHVHTCHWWTRPVSLPISVQGQCTEFPASLTCPGRLRENTEGESPWAQSLWASAALFALWVTVMFSS